eukprot:3557356-Pleurochrysis_carterae.AAC.1
MNAILKLTAENSNFTTGPRARSAVSTASASSQTSVRTAPCSLSSPTTSSMRARTADKSCWRAAVTLAGIAPSAGSTPVNFKLEKTVAQAASPYSGSPTRRATVCTPCGRAAPASSPRAPAPPARTAGEQQPHLRPACRPLPCLI